MFLLAPLGLLWLVASLPALIWLWRLSGTHRQLRIPSLVPFEHLLKRPSRQRTILVVNALFWLQVAILTTLTFALAILFASAMISRMCPTVIAPSSPDGSSSMGQRVARSSRSARACSSSWRVASNKETE